MFTLLTIATLALSAASSALAAPTAQQLPASCTFADAAGFTLAAFSTAGPNANTTGVPLVLGANGGIEEIQFKVLSVRAVSCTFTT